MSRFNAVLFDLDGTLIDTAPDLGFALNAVLVEQGYDPLPLDIIRPVASHGCAGLIKLGFGFSSEDDRYPALQQQLLEIYQANIARESNLFPGMQSVLNTLQAHQIPWGVVTNKPAFLTDVLMRSLQLDTQAACIVSGDTTPHSKPHPAPIFHACQQLQLSPEVCLYIGDALRDIQAGKAAEMTTLIASYGYISTQDDLSSWQADGIVDSPEAILSWLN